jgi:uncharacterized membrane protein YraQ (UPF0718 family)
MEFRRWGISKPATSSFLVATPETGVDSILLTYRLTDPILTIARPVAAFITALSTGLVESIFGKTTPIPDSNTPTQSVSDECCAGCEVTTSHPVSAGLFSRVRQAIRYAFDDLLRDLAPYLLVGFVLAGLVSVLLEPTLTDLPAVFRSGWVGYLGAILVGLPLYVCATASTPLAAVLLASGFSPGAVLVFLLVGPATNVAAIAVLREILGGPATVRYILVIIIAACLCGLLLDQVYGIWRIQPVYLKGIGAHGSHWYDLISALFLSLSIVWLSLPGYVRKARQFFVPSSSDKK